MALTQSQIYAAGRNVVSGVAGALVAFGVMKQVDGETLLKALDQINASLTQIVTAIAAITAIVTPFLAKSASSPANQLAEGMKTSSTAQIVAQAARQEPQAAATAVAFIAPNEAITAVGNLRQVAAVITDPQTAAHSSSPSVITHEQARSAMQ